MPETRQYSSKVGAGRSEGDGKAKECDVPKAAVLRRCSSGIVCGCRVNRAAAQGTRLHTTPSSTAALTPPPPPTPTPDCAHPPSTVQVDAVIKELRRKGPGEKVVIFSEHPATLRVGPLACC